jgi:putative aldouronate transport system permease protein
MVIRPGGRRVPRVTPFDLANTAFLLAVVVATLYPFLFVVAVSLSSADTVMANRVTILPRGCTIAAYRSVLDNSMFWVAYRNTVLYTCVGTGINLALTCSLAYAISRPELPLRRLVTFMIVITIYFQGGIITTFIVVRSLGMYNTIWAVVLPFAVVTYNLMIVRTYMQTIPEEIVDSVRIDGGNDFQILGRLVLPLSKPVIATVGLFYAVGHWNHYFWPMVLLREKARQPLQVILRDMIIEHNLLSQTGTRDEIQFSFATESLVSASIVVAVLPILCIYPFIQRYFVKGVMLGSLKA